ncbi:hypothetical protein VTN77DRAFT_5243 [Rasamsonia byssochlamydoides]|uniref:uncharacterized protein n=1 Tax=Rasamsonia byssochlamydoides TaxID=89139 RepID=UPI003743B022
MAPKQKAQKMSIGTFLADENFGSWADEMEDMPLPAPPEPRPTYGGERRTVSSTATGFNGYGERDRAGFAPRPELPLPTHPPYTAHIGNLSFDATSSDVSQLFADCQVTNVRIVEDKLNRTPKGFGYVEFATVEGLKKALTYSGTTLQGRAIRVSIAEPPKEPQQPARDLSDWTRKGPLPDLPPTRRVSDRPGFGRNFDNVSETGSERTNKRFESSDGKVRDLNNWERKGPLSPIAPTGREGGRPRSNEGSGFRRSSPAWGEGRSQDGSRPPRRDFHDRPERTPTAAELDNSWRARMRPDPPAAKEPQSPAAPAQRPKLNLQKRTVSESETAAPLPRTGDAKSNPFGGARPIDTAAREREVEEKRERQRREAEERAKAEKAERAEKQRLAREQAKAEKAAAADANGSKEGASEAPQGKNFEILRRAGEEENGMTADADPEPDEAAAESAKAESTPAKETTANLPPSKANGNWRSTAAPVTDTPDEEGWSTVSSKQRNNRRGGGRGFA